MQLHTPPDGCSGCVGGRGEGGGGSLPAVRLQRGLALPKGLAQCMWRACTCIVAFLLCTQPRPVAHNPDLVHYLVVKRLVSQ